jgi:hypothetical protein
VSAPIRIKDIPILIDATKALPNGRQPVFASRFHSLSPQVYAKVTRFHRIRDNAVRSIGRTKFFDERLVGWTIKTLKIVPGSIISNHLLGEKANQLDLADAA